ncbi:MAG: PHP domain-containing protein [Acholeplasmataceae bacterium]|nr:PHP domain-containing protein [Acholeplasmataceae bacterium]
MIYYYDLHIHSVLSPDADVLMTPNNILNMANLKGLNIISVTDHNSLKQLPVLYEISKSYDMLFIPGVEITVEEGFHVLCYFKHIEDALTFDALIETCNHKQRYDEKTLGRSEITDIYDDVIEIYPYDLTLSLNLSLKQLILILKDYDHILVYAHVDRKKHSGIEFIHEIPLDAIEVTKHASKDFYLKNNIQNKIILHSSDAHQIIDILEKEEINQIELESLTIEAFFRYFHHG